jgi:hypothetical protein
MPSAEGRKGGLWTSRTLSQSSTQLVQQFRAQAEAAQFAGVAKSNLLAFHAAPALP